MCNSNNDPDCAPEAGPPGPQNDKCPNAIDLGEGGSFTVDFSGANPSADTTEGCGPKAPDLFYAFNLKASEYVYLSVLDNPYTGSQVQATLELYEGACPAPDGTGRITGCDVGNQSVEFCGLRFPLLHSGQLGGLTKPLGAGQYVVAVRSWTGSGKFTLTYHHAPPACLANGEIIPPSQMSFTSGTTCGSADNVHPSCISAGEAGEDHNFVVYKCPTQLLTSDVRRPHRLGHRARRVPRIDGGVERKVRPHRGLWAAGRLQHDAGELQRSPRRRRDSGRRRNLPGLVTCTSTPRRGAAGTRSARCTSSPAVPP